MTGKSALVINGFIDEDAFDVGLTCGGTLVLYIEPVNRQTFPQLDAVLSAVDENRPVAVATVVPSSDEEGGRPGRRRVVRPERAEGEVVPAGERLADARDD